MSEDRKSMHHGTLAKMVDRGATRAAPFEIRSFT
jgi:hypothetical protein